MNLPNELHTILYLVILQFKMIFPYWMVGVAAGSVVSVFASARINNALTGMNRHRFGLTGIVFTALLGAASPICMYGTVPLIASLGRKGFPQHLLASFMVSSILINPNLFIFSFALGASTAFIRLFACILAGVLAGILVRYFYKGIVLFDFTGFEAKRKCSSRLSLCKAFFSDMNRCIVKTAPYLLAGILLTALLDRYMNEEWAAALFSNDSGFDVVLAASLGVPVYYCGGGTIPLLKALIDGGMSLGSALAFMITGPATKLTNLSAVKTILGIRNFTLYIAYNILFAIAAGLLTDMVRSILR